VCPDLVAVEDLAGPRAEPWPEDLRLLAGGSVQDEEPARSIGGHLELEGFAGSERVVEPDAPERAARELADGKASNGRRLHGRRGTLEHLAQPRLRNRVQTRGLQRPRAVGHDRGSL